MNKLFSAILLAGGVALVIAGINASNSFGSDVSRVVSGTPTDRSMWLLIGGIVAVAAGSVGLFRGQKRN